MEVPSTNPDLRLQGSVTANGIIYDIAFGNSRLNVCSHSGCVKDMVQMPTIDKRVQGREVSRLTVRRRWPPGSIRVWTNAGIVPQLDGCR